MTDSTLWTGDVWKSDDWTEEQKAEARNKISSQTTQTTGAAYQEFRRNASSNWSSFYEQNKTNFFKDRHYLHKAFPNEFGWLYASVKSDINDSGDISDIIQNVEEDTNTLLQPDQDDLHIVEIGSGVGNAILPLLEQHTELIQQQRDTKIPQLHIHCLDFAPSAIKLLKEDERFQLAAKEGRATGHVYDLSAMHPSTIYIGNLKQQEVLSNSADVAILLFCLSAIGPHPSPPLSRAAKHVIDMLKPGGVLVFRDYGRLDEAQLKLGKEADKQLGDNFYRKGDGTGCYYFSLDDLRELFVNQNDADDKLECLELDYIQRVYRNRGDNTERRRVWVQGRFRKPVSKRTEENKCISAQSEIKLKQYIDDSISRWDDYYKNLSTESTSSLPSNLFNAFPEEFSPWKSWQQSSNKKGKRKPQHVQPPELNNPSDITIIDAGCGIGNDTILNLIERQQLCHENKDNNATAMQPPTLRVHFLDASNEAIRRLHKDSRYQYATSGGDNCNSTATNITSQVYNLALTQSTCKVSEQSADIVLLLFTLSAIRPQDHINAILNATNLLKPGGVVLFRDFGRYDYDQLILNSVVNAQLCDNFYVRGLDDSSSAKGTCCYFFELDEVRSLFTNAGLEVIQLEYITRIYKNKKDGTSYKRIWVQGRFKKR